MAELGTGELLIVLFLLGMLLLLPLLVMVTAALVFVWGPGWLERLHSQWHAGDRDSADNTDA